MNSFCWTTECIDKNINYNKITIYRLLWFSETINYIIYMNKKRDLCKFLICLALPFLNQN